MKKLYFILLLSAMGGWSNNANSQSLAWARQMVGSGSGQASSVAVDAGGNVYTAGGFTGTADFDPGAGTYNLTATSANGNIFVSKLDASGDFIWAKQLGGTSLIQSAHSIAVDAGGNVYVTGEFSGTIDFDPGTGTYNLMAPGAYDVYVLKLNSSGDLVWARQFIAGTDHTDYGYSIAVDGSGNVYTAGQFMSTCDFDPGPGTSTLTSTGNNDIFVSKLTASGDLAWAIKMGGAASDGGLSLALDGSGNIYASGWFMGTADFDPGPGTFNLSSSAPDDGDTFVCKLNNAGDLVWAKRMGGTGIESGNAIAVDADGNVLTTGNFSGTSDFDPGPGVHNLSSIADVADVFVSKLDDSGNFIWAGQMGGSQADFGYGIAVDAGGNVYTTGYFNSATADFDPGAGTYDLTCFVVKDVFISQLDPSGNFLWAGQFGGPDYDDGFGITTDGSGNVYAAGDFRSTADFDPGAGTYDLTCPGFGANTFVVKLSDLSTGMPGNNDPFNALTIYPDPSTGQELWIRLGGLSTTIRSVAAEVRDMSGRRVSAQLLTAQGGQVNAEMPLPAGSASGVYAVTVTAGGSRWSARWVIATH